MKELINKILSNKVVSGLGNGEKVLLSSSLERGIFLCADFVTAGKIKRGLEGFGKKAEILTSAREGKDFDSNLLPLVCSLANYLTKKTDFLIVLPCSLLLKFDLKYFQSPIRLTRGEDYDLKELSLNLAKIGFERSELVSQRGQFALRGDILDIYPINEDLPIRLEFFGDTVEKISFFDINSMKNKETLFQTEIFPCLLPLGKEDFSSFEGILIVDQPKRIIDESRLLIKSYSVTEGYDECNYASIEKILKKCDFIFDNESDEGYRNDKALPGNYITDFMALKNDILSYLNMKAGVLLYGGNENNKGKLLDFLRDNQIFGHDYEKESFERGKVFVSQIAMPYSYSFLKEGIVAVGQDSLFKNTLTNFSKDKHSVFYLPKINDYVVHTFHGIGKCVNIERLKLGDFEKDYFVIEYRNGGVLYLPSEQANTISAYIGGEEVPKLSALGGGEFERLKNRVRSSLKVMALSLTEIYKERQQKKGFCFKRDEFLETKFAQSFGFVETTDQLKAIHDVDKDMESRKIMERLICGDVGFGKTEVALRAAFKCAYNGKQSALLCPTTILSEQHYRTAKERLEPFGVKVEVLNRFKTPAQAKKILANLVSGEVDLLIGTHRLLNQDVKYKDLGLLILDEEQRFGVEHKEKIKNSKRDIDVLSLSATPIPRTLNMSLSGIRDISVIETPPKERLPIQTYVAEQSDGLFKDVLKRELARGGQAFIVYNRVESIDEFAAYIRQLVPESRVGVGHGQMDERQLERVIADLYEGKYNIFIATTIIENGIDLPAANSLIVVEADKLGLGQLYQIRGRIGRSDRLSYAYLTYVKDKILTPEAYKRLEAIRQFSHLGSGFKIAMRDLELRGAGNIFGKEQHGHIAKVGYDMYVKLLDEALEELKGNQTITKTEVKLEISLNAFISENYISSADERIVFYTKISEISSKKELADVMISLNDGFGQVPKETENLCKIAYLKNLSAKFGAKRIVINQSACIIYFEKSEEILNKRLAELLSEFGGKLSFDRDIKVIFEKQTSNIMKLHAVLEFFEKAL